MGKYNSDIDEFVSACENHNIRKETCFNLLIICCSEQMADAGIDPKTALKKATELITNQKDMEIIYKTILEMTGYNLDEDN